MKLEIFKPRDPLLASLIQNFWICKDSNSSSQTYRLVPTHNHNLILNFSENATIDNHTMKIMELTGFHNKPINIKVSGKVDIIGVTFYPHALYTCLKTPMYEIENVINRINDTIIHKCPKLDTLSMSKTAGRRIHHLEEILLTLLNPNSNMINSFLNRFEEMCGSDGNIQKFCSTVGISQRTLERNFKNEIGSTPKFYLKLLRFKKCYSTIIKGNYRNLTQIAYENDYFDQNHFIKDFKRFTGLTPSSLVKLIKSGIDMSHLNILKLV